MQITEYDLELDLSRQFARDAQPQRSAGTHISDVIQWISRRTLHPERVPVEEMSQAEREQMCLYTSFGFSWEIVVRDALQKIWRREFPANPARYIHVGEVQKDGLSGSPDWVDVVEESVPEFKATWRSSKNDPFQEWIWQVKAYDYLLGFRKAEILAYFVNGNYRPSKPKIRGLKMEVTPRELHDNWQMLLGNARAMQRERMKNGETSICI